MIYHIMIYLILVKLKDWPLKETVPSLRQRLKGSNLSSGPSPAIEQTGEVERKECQKCYVGMNSFH